MTYKLRVPVEALSADRHRPVLIGILVLYGVLIAVSVPYHEMWRDELLTWLAARASETPLAVVSSLAYNPHPPLWDIIVHLAAVPFGDPIAMQILHAIIMLATVSLFIFFSPFSTLQKCFLPFGYFFLFEYGIIARGIYLLGIFFLTLACVLLLRPSPRLFGFFVALGFASLCNELAAIIGLCFALVVACEGFLGGSDTKSNVTSASAGLAIFLSAFLLSVWLVVPESNEVGGLYLKIEPYHMLQTLHQFWRAYFPIPYIYFDLYWWNITLFDYINAFWLAMLSVIVFLVFVAIIGNYRIPLAFYVLANGMLMGFIYAIYTDPMRVVGHLFLILLLALWLAWAAPSRYSRAAGGEEVQMPARHLLDRLGRQALTVVLTVQLAAGAFAFWKDLTSPFALGKAAAEIIVEIIKSKGEAPPTIIAGYPVPLTSSISAWLDQPIYYLQREAFGSYPENTVADRRVMSADEVIASARTLAERERLCVLLITGTGFLAEDPHLRHIATVEGSITGEDYAIHSLVSPDSSACDRTVAPWVHRGDLLQ